MLSARVASTVLAELLKGPQERKRLREMTGASKGTMARAVALLRQSGIKIGNTCTGGSTYVLKDPDGVRWRLSGALRLSLGDLIEAGGVAPALGVGLLIEAGCI